MEGRAFIRIPVLLLLCSMGMVNVLHAQLAPQTDSLKTLLERSEGVERIGLLHKLSEQNSRTNADSAIHYAEKALALSKQLEEVYYIAESHRKVGRFLSVSGNNPEGLQHLLKAEEQFREMGDSLHEALTGENIGALYKRQSDYSKALEYYYNALELREQMANPGDIANTLINIGVIHEELGQPEQSVDYYKRALEISEEKNDLNSMAITGVQLGNLYASMGQSEEGIRYMKQALRASEQLPGEHARSTVLLSLSSLYKDRKSYSQALEANRQALALAEKLNSKTLKVLAQKNIAAVYEDRNNYEAAREYLLQSLRLLEEGGSQQQIIETRNLLARNYQATGNYSESIEQAQQALEAATKSKAFEPGANSLRILAEVYEETGNFRKGMEMQKRITSFRDSIYSAEQARRIAEMQTRYETEQKEQEIALLREEQAQARLLRNAFAAGLVLILIIGILIYNRQKLMIKKNRTELENRRLKERQLEQDLEYKNRELSTHSLHMVQKNETMKELKNSISEIKKMQNGTMSRELQKLENMVDYSFNLDEDWEQFMLYFDEVHSGFFNKLKERFPDLTPNELRLCALAKLNLSVKETATIMGITPDSVKTARYRLRKKLDMETEENLTEFMMQIEKESL